MCRPGTRRVLQRELSVLHTRSATITGRHTPPGVRRRPGGELLGLRPQTSPPGQISHPDCRAVLILIDAQHVWRDKQGEKPATIKMRKPKPLSG